MKMKIRKMTALVLALCLVPVFASGDTTVSIKPSMNTAIIIQQEDGAEKLENSAEILVMPADPLKEGAYDDMFSAAKGIEKAPELPAPTLVKDTYHELFEDSSRLSRVDISLPDGIDAGVTSSWLEDAIMDVDAEAQAEVSIPDVNGGKIANVDVEDSKKNINVNLTGSESGSVVTTDGNTANTRDSGGDTTNVSTTGGKMAEVENKGDNTTYLDDTGDDNINMVDADSNAADSNTSGLTATYGENIIIILDENKSDSTTTKMDLVIEEANGTEAGITDKTKSTDGNSTSTVTAESGNGGSSVTTTNEDQQGKKDGDDSAMQSMNALKDDNTGKKMDIAKDSADINGEGSSGQSVTTTDDEYSQKNLVIDLSGAENEITGVSLTEGITSGEERNKDKDDQAVDNADNATVEFPKGKDELNGVALAGIAEEAGNSVETVTVTMPSATVVLDSNVLSRTFEEAKDNDVKLLGKKPDFSGNAENDVQYYHVYYVSQLGELFRFGRGGAVSDLGYMPLSSFGQTDSSQNNNKQSTGSLFQANNAVLNESVNVFASVYSSLNTVNNGKNSIGTNISMIGDIGGNRFAFINTPTNVTNTCDVAVIGFGPGAKGSTLNNRAKVETLIGSEYVNIENEKNVGNTLSWSQDSIALLSGQTSTAGQTKADGKTNTDGNTTANGKKDTSGQTNTDGKTEGNEKKDTGGKTNTDGKTEGNEKKNTNGKTEAGGKTEGNEKKNTNGQSSSNGKTNAGETGGDGGSANVKGHVHQPGQPVVEDPDLATGAYYLATYCTDPTCNALLNKEYVEPEMPEIDLCANGHSFTNYVSNGDAKCEADGTKTAVCDNGCGATDTIPDPGSALEHSFTTYVSNGDAKCEADGTKTALCDHGCGKTDTVTDPGSALEHSFTTYVSNGDAKCEADGTKTAVCDHGCGKTDTISDPGSALGHSFTTYVSNGDAKCEADGTKTAVCDHGCGKTDTISEPGSALGHSFTTYVSNGDAKCLADGTKTAVCDHGCGKTDTVPDPGSALGHSFTSYTRNGDASCTVDGTKTAVCDRCSARDTIDDEGSASGHLFLNYQSNHDAKCGKDGTKTAHCEHDGCLMTDTIPDEGTALEHVPVTDEAVAATCSSKGKTAGSHCELCGEVLVAQTETEMLPHTPVTDAAEPATCTKKGKTEGSHCSACGEVLVAQTETEMLPHTPVTDAAEAATCTKKGKTEGSHCSTCGEVLVAQAEIEMLQHTPVTDAAEPATCTKKGKTEGSHCSACGEVLVAQTETEMLQHIPVTDAAEPGTCMKKGKTEGSHCSVCGQVLVAQTETDFGAHTPGAEQRVNEVIGDCYHEGSVDYVVYCTQCNTEISRRQENTGRVHSNIKEEDYDDGGKKMHRVYCDNCKATISETEIQPSGEDLGGEPIGGQGQ